MRFLVNGDVNLLIIGREYNRFLYKGIFSFLACFTAFSIFVMEKDIWYSCRSYIINIIYNLKVEKADGKNISSWPDY